MRTLNKLKKLIKQYCPDGVKFLHLNTILDYEQPTKYIVETTNYNNLFKVPVLTAGQTFVLGYTNENNGIYEASKKNPVIIFDDFTTSFHWVDFNFKIKSSAMKILKIKPEKNRDLLFRYIYHCMKNISYQPGDHSRQWIAKYSNFKIPVPPVSVQAEIVRILDNFTNLTEVLKDELDARKKQYNYYKFNLFETFDKVEYKALKDVCEIQTGGTPVKTNSAFWKNGTIKWLGSSVCQNTKTVSNITDYITELGLINSSTKLFKANTTLIALVGATIGKIAFLPFEASVNQNIVGLYPKNISEVDPSYIYYACSMLYSKFLDLNKGKLGMANLTFIKNLKIPIPSLLKQQQIVRVLDYFELLCNDTSYGLTAEIKARQQQYEYYRNKLLTFKEKERENYE